MKRKICLSLVLLAFLPVVVYGKNPLRELKKELLRQPVMQIDGAGAAAFGQPVSERQSATAAELIGEAYYRQMCEESEQMWRQEAVVYGDYRMPFYYRISGDKPADGRSLYISMHGGGNAPVAVNNQQWENQKRLYRPAEGVYLAPRAAVDDWNMWHQEHVDHLFETIVRTAVARFDVNPDKVYILGYSAGGDGAFQLAPRLADHWAAAAMMAGHPDNARPDNLRNIGFTIWMGEKDGAYDRNKHAAEWKVLLDSCRRSDPAGYEHEVNIVSGRGHWMERQDTLALDFLARFVRNPYPDKVVWRQDDVIRPAFYWLSVPAASARMGQKAVVSYEGNTVTISENDYPELTIWLNDKMVDLDRPVTVVRNGRTLFSGKVPRTVGNLLRTMRERGDVRYFFPAGIVVSEYKGVPVR